jgi:hypothetical protein
VVGYGLGPVARMERRRKEASGEIKEKDAGVGSFECTTRKRPRTKDDDDDDDDLGNKLALIGLKPWAESVLPFLGIKNLKPVQLPQVTRGQRSTQPVRRLATATRYPGRRLDR